MHENQMRPQFLDDWCGAQISRFQGNARPELETGRGFSEIDIMTILGERRMCVSFRF